MFQKQMAQITSAETQTSHTHGFSNGKQQHCFSSQNINCMSPCDSKGKQNSVMLWANTDMTVLIAADEKRTKPGQRGCSAHLWLRRHKITEVVGKNIDRGEENYSDVTRESYWNSNRNIEKREPQSLRTITLKIKVRLQWKVYCPCTKDCSRRLVILGKAWPARQNLLKPFGYRRIISFANSSPKTSPVSTPNARLTSYTLPSLI